MEDDSIERTSTIGTSPAKGTYKYHLTVLLPDVGLSGPGLCSKETFSERLI